MAFFFGKWHSLRETELTDDDLKYIKNYQPLTAKPLMIAVNFSENEIKNSDRLFLSFAIPSKVIKFVLNHSLRKLNLSYPLCRMMKEQFLWKNTGLLNLH
jgi:hypothetical protein